MAVHPCTAETLINQSFPKAGAGAIGNDNFTIANFHRLVENPHIPGPMFDRYAIRLGPGDTETVLSKICVDMRTSKTDASAATRRISLKPPIDCSIGNFANHINQSSAWNFDLDFVTEFAF